MAHDGVMPDIVRVTQQMVQEWHEAARRGDAQAAYRIAEFALKRGSAGDRDSSEAWFREAATLGGVPMLWQIADLTKEQSAEIGARWQREAIATEWRDSGVAVDEDTFRLYAFNGGAWTAQDFHVLVRGEPDEAVGEVLEAARVRLYCVGNDGTEYPDEDAAIEADYNPNYVSDPEAHPGGGWRIWMDCKSEAYPLMAATQLRILVEELRRAGVTAIRIGPDERP
jgi:hypothetical protein